jgi:hypothetical protein
VVALAWLAKEGVKVAIAARRYDTSGVIIKCNCALQGIDQGNVSIFGFYNPYVRVASYNGRLNSLFHLILTY